MKMTLSMLALFVAMSLCIVSAFGQDHNAKEFRITQPTNGKSFVFLPAPATVQQTIIFPIDPPLTTEHALVVRSISGSTVTTAWAPPLDPGASSYWVRKTADQANNDVAFIDATDLTFNLVPNKAYYIEGFLRVTNSGDANANLETAYSAPVGTTLHYYYVSSTQIGGNFQTDDADVEGGFTETVNAVLPIDGATVRLYNIQMYLAVTTGGPLQLRFKRTGGNGTVSVLANSVMKIFTD